MKTKTKRIQFDLLKPYFIQDDKYGFTEEKLYDLKPFFEHISNNPLVNTKNKVYGDYHMFYKCKHHDTNNIWELQLLHLREQMLPGISDGDTEFELIKLGENQYPAESTTVIYDGNTNIIYMHRNVYGTSIRALTALIQVISPEGTSVVLKPIIKSKEINKIKQSSFFKSVILVADSEQLEEGDKQTGLGKIISSFSEYKGKVVSVNLGFGRSRGFLKSNETAQLVREAYEFPGTQKLKVSLTDSEDGKIEKVDLLDDKEKITFDIEYSRGNMITHERLFKKCMEKIKKDKRS